MPVDGEKHWIRRKGCKNAAKMWSEEKQEWFVVPMVPGKEIRWVSHKIRLSTYPSTRLIKKPYYTNLEEKDGFRIGINSKDTND